MYAADFERAKVVRRGRPPKLEPKVAIHFRVDPQVLAYFKALGPGYQTRMNEVLSKHVRTSKPPPSPKKRAIVT
jgi:uncharacterized protein (DUF4415 family)